MSKLEWLSHKPEETVALAGKFAKYLKAGDIVLLKGDLGAGKTTFTQGLGKALRVNEADVNSPTFILMNYYEGRLPVYHFDFYRINKMEELATVDLEEYFYGRGVCVIEWPERLGELAPKEYFQIDLEHKGESARALKLSACGEVYQKRLKEIRL
jgi:tRNA threonylcarbamoyladenosine biosynthesis protein TsaE